MTKDSKELLGETEKLKIEIRAIRHQLEEAKNSIEAIKTSNIDALVTVHENDLKIFTENTADKPYRILIEKMHEGAILLHEDGSILYCNSSFANMVNIPLYKITGTEFKKYIDNSMKKHFVYLLNQGEVNAFQEEGYIYAEGGKVIPVLMTLNTLTLDNIFVLNIILTDLTVQNEHQEILRRKAKLIEEKNQELENVNKELAFHIQEKERQAAELAMANIELAIAEELVIAYKELSEETAERKKREAELSIARTDVKELEGLNIHKENVLNTISHDLRSPLAGIIQMTELLKDNFEYMEGQELKKLLNILYDLSTDELRMLDDLVEWARIKYAAEAFSPANIDLVKYVKKAFDTLNELAIVNKVYLHNEIKDDIIVYADKKMLLSILQNLVSNAIKYNHPEGKVIVSAKREKDKIIVEVKDTGIGMCKEVEEKLFDPQMKALSHARKENKGAGIGLLLIKGFVAKNGGEICVESIEGKGTCFYFTLLAEKPMV